MSLDPIAPSLSSLLLMGLLLGLLLACDGDGGRTDPTGLLPSEVDGGSSDTRFWLLWSTNQGACRMTSSAEGTITLTHGLPTQLTGTLFWSRSANGQGSSDKSPSKPSRASLASPSGKNKRSQRILDSNQIFLIRQNRFLLAPHLH